MNRKFLIGLLLLPFSASVFANPVTVNDARNVAKHFIEMKTGNATVFLSQYEYNTSQKDNNNQALYIFTTNQHPGFVIVSGDDVVQPILGYSLTNDFAGNKKMSPEVQYWLNGYASQIRRAQQSKQQASLAVQDEWKNLQQTPELGNGNATAQKATGVSPMLSTTWDQLPYYNDDCPATPYSPYNPTLHAPTGCVATAMAQIMKYWETPTTTGSGSHSYSSSTVGGTLSANFGNTTYDWTNMPNSLNNNSSSTEVSAIATLMYHCGVAVEMDYDTTESGAYVINYGNTSNFACSQNSMPEYFGYSSSIKGYERSQFDDSTWIKMLKFELDNGRPVLYTGYGSLGGHAFDFDGYNNNGYFHINWGWGGMSNGYFVIDNLSPSALGQGGGGGNFNSGQEALIMIEPDGSNLPSNPYQPGGQTSINFNLTYTQSPQSPMDTIHVGDPYSISSVIKNNGPDDFNQNGYQLFVMALDMSSHQGVLIDEQQQTLHAGDVYQYDFNSQALNDLTPGTYFMTYGYQDNGGISGDLITDSTGSYIGTMLTILPRNTGVKNIPSPNNFKIYPNPANNLVTIQPTSEKITLQEVQLYDALGRKVLERKNNSNSNTMSVSVAQLPSGMYYLKLTSGHDSQMQKLFIRH